MSRERRLARRLARRLRLRTRRGNGRKPPAWRPPRSGPWRGGRPAAAGR
nr:MAG TPA: hypothetical protein [Caudoviricetes sp.]